MRRLDPRAHQWMVAPETSAVMNALLRDGGAARFVGGAVRNALLGLAVSDIDIATPLVPQEVSQRLSAAGIAVHPTGIEHGTVTAVAGGRPFEVTSLRRDVATFGRHATVAFTQDWTEDAKRRDFTINALYAAQDGEIFDYAGGLDDLDAGRVRFVGDPSARIREDYLRILRLFRFHAWYGKGEVEAAALAAAEAEKAGLRILSAERVHKELTRLLEAKNPVPMLRAMAAIGVLAEVLPCVVTIARLERLVHLDGTNSFAADPVLRLAALIPSDAVGQIADRLRLSNADRDRLVDLAHAKGPASPYLSDREVHRSLYRLGVERFSDRIKLAWADDPDTSHASSWRAFLIHAEGWERPSLPVSGRDVLAAGVPEGPLVGRILSEIEAWWIDADFPEDKAFIVARLETLAKAASPT